MKCNNNNNNNHAFDACEYNYCLLPLVYEKRPLAPLITIHANQSHVNEYVYEWCKLHCADFEFSFIAGCSIID